MWLQGQSEGLAWATNKFSKFMNIGERVSGGYESGLRKSTKVWIIYGVNHITFNMYDV